MSTAHTRLVNAVIKAVQQHTHSSRYVRIFKRPNGLFFTANGQPVRSAIKGQFDVYGFIEDNRQCKEHQRLAVHFEIECKILPDVLSSEQKNWRMLCELMRVPYRIVTSSKSSSDIRNAALEAAAWAARIAAAP